MSESVYDLDWLFSVSEDKLEILNFLPCIIDFQLLELRVCAGARVWLYAIKILHRLKNILIWDIFVVILTVSVYLVGTPLNKRLKDELRSHDGIWKRKDWRDARLDFPQGNLP